jgi:type IV pilus assembly protein PilP
MAMLAIPLFVRAQSPSAQKPMPAAQKPATPATAAPPAQPPAPASQPSGEPYSYDPAGRRDPFVSLVSHGVEAIQGGKRSEGLGGLSTADLMVKGVLLSRGSYVALVAGPDGKTFAAHVNDKLLDGTVRSITPQGLVIMQEVNDPLSLIKQKEVRKGLRTSDDGKQ